MLLADVVPSRTEGILQEGAGRSWLGDADDAGIGPAMTDTFERAIVQQR